jgi:hypothetical protein
VAGGGLGEDGAEVRGEREVAPFVQLLGREAGPPAVHAPAAHPAADEEHAARVAVVRPAAPVLARGTAELAGGHDEHVLRAVAEVQDERRDAACEVVETVGELAGRATLRDVRVPPADVGECDLEPHARLDELGDLQQALAERGARVLGAVLGRVPLRVGRAERPHGLRTSSRPAPCTRSARPVV